MSEIEEWRVITDYPDYAVSSHGRVRRLQAVHGSRGARILKPIMNRYGYVHVSLRKNHKTKNMRINRLVCQAFHGDPPTPAHHAAHLDGVRTNNHKSNLAWKTGAENQADVDLHGRRWQGEINNKTKLSRVQVSEIRAKLGNGGTCYGLAKEYGVYKSTIRNIRDGVTWKHLKEGNDGVHQD